MSSRVSRPFLALLVLLCLAPRAAAEDPAALVQGLSHVPVAVQDLAAARKRYEQLGFAFKPGRPHDNGIENLHIKFRDGTEVELITAREARDDLTAEYVDFLRRGDGPAFFAIHAADQPGVLRALRAAGLKARQGTYGVSFVDGDPLDHIFFGGLNQSPTDRPEHFAHRNGAQSLIAVWLAADERGPQDRMFAHLHARPRARVDLPPLATRARRIQLAQGEVLLVPARLAVRKDRPIVGLTLRVTDVATGQRILAEAGHELRPVTLSAGRGRSLFIPPAIAGGYWLELRETAAR